MGEEESTGLPEELDLVPEETTELLVVDLNSATVDELRQLPGIGDTLAARIVEYRDETGPFEDPAEITAVTGVSEAMYSRLADRLTAGVVEPALASGSDSDLLEPEPEPEPEELEAETEDEDITATPESAEMEAEAEGEDIALAPEPVEMEAEAEGDDVVAALEPGEMAEPEPEPEHLVEAPPRGPEPPLVEEVQAKVGCGRLVLVGVLSALLGAVLALAIVFVINGTLDFQSAAIRAAQDEVLRMESVVGALNLKVAEVEERLGQIQELDARLSETRDALERLTGALDELRGRVESLAETHDALRQEFTNMREDLDGLAGHVSVLDRRLSETEAQILSLEDEIEILGQSVERFDAFLLGLRALLNEPLGDLAPTPTPWIEPTDSPEPTPTSWNTPVPRPQVTVIPLATPTPTPVS